MKLIISAVALAFATLSAPSFAAAHAASAPMAAADKKPAAAPAAPMAAADKKPSAQQSKMATCNKDAGEKKGDERKAFMKTCLSAKPAAAAASPACEKSATDKKLAGAAKTSHIKKCMADGGTAKS